MIDSPHRRAAHQPPNRRAQTPPRLIPPWNHAPGPRLTPRWTRLRLDIEFGAGYDYTYLFPGIRKVVQAAGRVIRTPSDCGTLHLIDDRFARPEVRRLLPTWWRINPE